MIINLMGVLTLIAAGLIAVMAFYYDWLKYLRLRRLQRT